MSWKYFPSCQSVSQKVLTMFEKQLDGQMAPEKRDHGNLAVKARCFNFKKIAQSLLFPMRNDFAGLPVTESPPQSMLVHMISSSHSGARSCDSSHGSDMIFVISFTQAYFLIFRNLPEENDSFATFFCHSAFCYSKTRTISQFCTCRLICHFPIAYRDQ